MKKAFPRAISFFLALTLLLALLPTVAIPQASATTGYDLGYAGGRNGDGVQYAYGIDVSEHQGTGFDFQNLKNNGYSYVILRCGFVTRKDYRFEEYYTNAKAAGLDVGAYFYSYATTADEAAYEAERCLSYISGKTFEYPIYFDFEDSSAYSGSSTTAYNLCMAFLDKVAAAGYLVGLYGYAGWFDESYAGSWVPVSSICQKYECWIANYYDSDGSTKNSYYSTRYGMYQYTSTNYVGGVGPLDTNRCYKDYPSIVKQYGFNGYSATGASSVPDGTYRVSSYLNTDYTLTIGDSAADNGANAELQQWGNTQTQKFVFEYAGSGYYTIRNLYSGKYLDCDSGNSANGTNVLQWESNSADNQLWSMKSAGDGYYYIVNKANGLYLDVVGSNAASGTNVDVWTGGDYDNQKWLLTPTDVVTDGVYRVTAASDGNYGWTIGAESTENGANAQIWSTTHPVALQRGSDGYYTIRFLHSDKYLDVEGSASSNGTNLCQWEGATEENHKFLIVPNTDGSYSFVAKCNGLYVDAEGGTMSDGTNLQCYEGNDSTAQKWTLTPCRTINDGVYQIGAYDDSSYVIDVAGHVDTEGTCFHLWEDNDADGQRFAIEYRGNGNYTVRDLHSNRFMDVYHGQLTDGTSLIIYGDEDSEINDNKLFRIIPYSDGSYALVSVVSNQYVDLSNGDCYNGGRIHTWTSNLGNAQHWWFMPTTTGLDGEYIIAASGDDSYVLDIANASADAGANLQIYKANGSDAQRFKLVDGGNGYYLVQNVNSGRYLNINNNGSDNGTNVIQWNNSTASDNEYWSVIPHSDGTVCFVGKCNGLYLDLSSNNLANETNVQVWENTNGRRIAAQRWTLLTHTHSFVDQVVAPTCTENGYTSHTCTECGYSFNDTEVAALGHDEVPHAAKAATCTEKGWDAYVTCTRCDHTTYQEIPALGHDEITHQAQVETCTGIGWNTYVTCSRCEYSTYEEIAALGHDPISHAAKDPTCTSVGWDAYVTCSRCDYSTYHEIPALGHDYVLTGDCDASCTEDGYTGDMVCTRCGDVSQYGTVIPATGHTEVTDEAVDPTCTEAGKTEGKHCSTCGEILVAQTEIEALGHDYRTVVLTEPTCTTAGSALKLCRNCDEGHSEPIPATGHTYKDGACSVCGAAEFTPAADLKFAAKTLSLQSYTAFKLMSTYSVLNNYDSYYVVFERYDAASGTTDTLTTEGAVSTASTRYHAFEYPVYAYALADEVTATLYGVKDGVTYVGETYTSSVRDYVLGKIGSAKESMKSVYANLLYYGTYTQKLMDYKTDDLAITGLGTYKRYITTTVPTTSSVAAGTIDGYNKIGLTSKALGLNAAVEIQFILSKTKAYTQDQLYAVYTFERDGETVTGRIDGEDFSLSSGYWVIKVDALTAMDGKTPVSVTVYSKANDSRLSETWTYSIESHVNAKVSGKPSTTQQYVLVALMNYYNAVEAAYK